MTPTQHAACARALAETLPKLLLEAERLAFAAAPGIHGRRRGGAGDAFWQFRDWRTGTDAKHIDWRRSARSDRLYIKEREWDAQANIALVLEDTESLTFASNASLPIKRDRAILLLLALAAILLRAGERVALAGRTPPFSGRQALQPLATALLTGGAAPWDAQARLVRFGDFLTPNPLFAAPQGGAIIQVLDPAEVDFPYQGRVIFESFHGDPPIEAPNAAAWRLAYQTRLAAHRRAITDAAGAAGQTLLCHRTDHAPATALGAIAQCLMRA